MGVNGQGGLDAEALRRRRAVTEAETSLVALITANPAAGEALSRLVHVVAAEAARTPRFAKALADALGSGPAAPAPARTASKPAAWARRAKGLLDPFAVFAVSGEAGLRARLSTLTVDQLKDIIAEHGMNHDGAAMRWKSASRLVDRIVERVETRSTKGDVLR